jgi:hypothetical protein
MFIATETQKHCFNTIITAFFVLGLAFSVLLYLCGIKKVAQQHRYYSLFKLRHYHPFREKRNKPLNLRHAAHKG